MPTVNPRVRLTKVPDYLITALASRSAAFWLGEHTPLPAEQVEPLGMLMRLPWGVVVCDSSASKLAQQLERPASDQDWVRIRGYLHLIDLDPNDVELPPRALPVYFANGRDDASEANRRPGTGLSAQRRRLNVLHELQIVHPSYLVVLPDDQGAPLDDLRELWGHDGFRPKLLVIDPGDRHGDRIDSWIKAVRGIHSLDHLIVPISGILQELTRGLTAELPGGRLIVKMLAPDGTASDIDVTECELAEYPLLSKYELIQARDLRPILPDELSDAGLNAFFERTSYSWEAYAAGLPWDRSPTLRATILNALERVSLGDDTPLLLIQSESGAGATTLARAIGFATAQAGYPTLIARDEPFSPNPTEIRTFLDRVAATARASGGDAAAETPWLIVFDVDHWRGREEQLLVFHREIERSGRQAVILAMVQRLDERLRRAGRTLDALTHDITQDEALALGRHLNKYLSRRDRALSESEWEQFWRSHTLDFGKGTLAGSFWIGLEFWLRRQIPLGESIQTWLYRQFHEAPLEDGVRLAVLEVAAMTSERLPLPDQLLGEAGPSRSVPEDLEAVRSAVPGLALKRFWATDRQWYLAHDLIGRYLIAAAFHDWQTRDRLGLGMAQSPVHLRLLLLKQIASRPALGLRAFRELALEFAVNLFKLDTGRLEFAQYWSDVLDALDRMPAALKEGSRTFNHHTAITRRRIATMDTFFSPTPQQQRALLTRAIADLKFALEIPARPGDESDLNLYNSLALAYQNLVETERQLKSPVALIESLLAEATRAARKAEELDSRNSYVLETLARNLIVTARLFPETAPEKATEALVYVFQALSLDRAADRREALVRYANEALSLLRTPEATSQVDLLIARRNPFGLLARAWLMLAGPDQLDSANVDLSVIPQPRLTSALEMLNIAPDVSHPLVLRLRYDITVILKPRVFTEQLSLLDELFGTSRRMPLQLQLEHAILLHQCHQHRLGEEQFRKVRRLLQDESTDEFVEVPPRLFWLYGPDGRPRPCSAVVQDGRSSRGWARVAELQNQNVPFIPQEFGNKTMSPNHRFTCFIRFGWKGPLITRPQEREDAR